MAELSPEYIAELVKNGEVLLIDKPWGYTSHYLVNGVRIKYDIQRVGHAGTLDPLATGLMIVLVGRNATKLQDHFLHLPKSYEFTAELGVTTDTYDITGAVVTKAPWEKIQQITEEKIAEVLEPFIGTYSQQVPAYSAVRVNGKRLYSISRAGKTAERPSKPVTITALELLDFHRDNNNQKLTFSCVVHCGSGTYIRSLVDDIGRQLGVGATVTHLRRTQVGRFSVSEAQQWIFAEQHKPILSL